MHKNTLDNTHESVQDYYGQVLHSSKDLKTNACCSLDAIPEHLKSILKKIEPDVLERFYGCGAPVPTALEGCTVLDLGCGSGRDTYMAASLVGENGHVFGLDMTDEQLDVSRKCLTRQMERFGYTAPNVTFLKGYIEDLKAAGIEDNSIDVIISDCVINLSPDKESVFREAFRVLKPGGELYFSDVVADRRLPKSLMKDEELLGECLAGAMYHEDFRRMMADIGCADIRKMSTTNITIENAQIESKIGMANFYSITYRVFKLPLEDRCEDFGQVAYYKGTIPHYPHRFELDDHHVFETDKPLTVCGNTAAMLEDTRYGRHFRISGEKSKHFGLYDCGEGPAPTGDGTGCC